MDKWDNHVYSRNKVSWGNNKIKIVRWCYFD